MEIKLLSNDTEKIWDKLIQQSPFCRFSETTNFKNVLKETYYYKPNYLLIKNQGQIIALLPAVRKNKKLISMPFADYGDLIIINPIVSPAEIVQALKNFLQEKNINYLKIISGLNIQSSSLQKHFQKQPNDSRAVLILDKDPDSLFKKFDYSVRKAIKKSESANLKCSQNNSPEAIKNHFYPLYLKSMKRFGTPPHSLDYFLNKLKCFSNDLKLYLVTKDGLVVAALMGFTCGKNIHITKNPSLKKFWNCRPNDLAHWEFIKWGCEHGYTSFDFGPVRYENQKRYKEKWGAKIQNNYIFYLYPENSRLRQGYGGQAKPSKQNLTTHNLGFKFISFIWKYFIPISLAQHLGPIIRKRLAR